MLEEPLDLAQIRDQYEQFAECIRPMVCDTARLLNEAIRGGKRVLFEGAQGTMLDMDHGTYPFVTSSSAAAGGACTGTGVAPTQDRRNDRRLEGVHHTCRVADHSPRKITTRWGRQIRPRGNEYGAVTGTPAPLRLVRRSAASLHSYGERVRQPGHDETRRAGRTRGDSGLRRVPLDNVETAEMPATFRGMQSIEPVFENLPGWQTTTKGISHYDELPAAARDYVPYLESRTGVEVGCVSTGPERTETMIRKGSRLEGLLQL